MDIARNFQKSWQKNLHSADFCYNFAIAFGNGASETRFEKQSGILLKKRREL